MEIKIKQFISSTRCFIGQQYFPKTDFTSAKLNMYIPVEYFKSKTVPDISIQIQRQIVQPKTCARYFKPQLVPDFPNQNSTRYFKSKIVLDIDNASVSFTPLFFSCISYIFENISMAERCVGYRGHVLFGCYSLYIFYRHLSTLIFSMQSKACGLGLLPCLS